MTKLVNICLNQQFSMKTMFRLYAKTSKGNDRYLYNELISMGLKPQYQDLIHSFFFNANFNDLFKLSFESLTVQNLYIQLGHRFPLSTTRSSTIQENQSLVNEYLRKINFRNYLPMQRGLVENITLKLLVRESSSNLPSQNAIISIFQNYLQKQVIMKEYRNMFRGQYQNRMQNYYDIKHIVQKKWDHEDDKKQQQLKLLQQSPKSKQLKLIGETTNQARKSLILSQSYMDENQNQVQLTVPYSPHFILYIRRNHARLLLKLNKQSMHKFGWKKNVGWGPIRETLTASILYRSGLVDQFKASNNITFWDPFCGSGTIPLVLYTMLQSLKVRRDIQSNFIWQHWPIYNHKYLKDYIDKTDEAVKKTGVKIFGSDIDIDATRSTIDNFKQLVNLNEKTINASQKGLANFLKCNPSDQIFQILPSTIYIGCGDFQSMASKIFIKENQKVNIATNLPYLGERSKQHHPINQLHSIYKRFNQMVRKYSEYIDNIFVIVDSDVNNKNHFVKTSKEEWRILQIFNNGGIQICLLGWAKNNIGSKNIQTYSQTNQNRAVTEYDGAKTQYLSQYRKQMKDIQSRRYELPAYLDKSKQFRSTRRVLQKKKARHLRAAYIIFAKQRDKKYTFEKYARKNLALRLSQRGKTWKQRNLSMMEGNLQGKQDIIKRQFETRIQQALKKSQQIKNRKKGVSEKVKRKW